MRGRNWKRNALFSFAAINPARRVPSPACYFWPDDPYVGNLWSPWRILVLPSPSWTCARAGVLRTIITRISLRNSPAIESAPVNVIRNPDLARVVWRAWERKKEKKIPQSGIGVSLVHTLARSLEPAAFRWEIRPRSLGGERAWYNIIRTCATRGDLFPLEIAVACIFHRGSPSID